MKLWLLQHRTDIVDDNPWQPWYGKALGFVIAAPDEPSARVIAANNAIDKQHRRIYGYSTLEDKRVWIESKYSTCKELKAENYSVPTKILRDFASA